MKNLLNWTENYLADFNIPRPKTEAELLLSGFLNCARMDLYMERVSLDETQKEKFYRLVKERSRKVPLQILLGNTRFMDWPFLVEGGVFIPRPETEILVETAYRIINDYFSRREIKILDLGTGTGNIAASLAKKFSQAKVYAVDKSSRAILLAQKNARILKVDEQVYFRQGDLFTSLSEEDCLDKFSLVISNPPYIPAGMLSYLPPEVKNFDPVLSLDGGEDGLLFYRRILSESGRYLADKAFLIMEIGENQAGEIKNIVGASGKFKFCELIRDYQDKERVVVIRNY